MDKYLEKRLEGPSTMGSSSRSRTILWCVPRSGSTALIKCLSAIDGLETWFEPYCYCHVTEVEYKLASGTDIPTVYEGNEETFARAKQLIDNALHIDSMPERLAYTTVQRNLENSPSDRIFFKDMGWAMVKGQRQFLPRGYKHTFLIRNPLKFLHSYRKSMFGVQSRAGTLEGAAADWLTFDLERDDRYWPSGCYMKELYDLWKYVKDTGIDSDPVVIDTVDLLTKPKETLSRYCALVGLPYHDGLLQWDASVKGFHKMKTCGDNVIEKIIHFYEKAMTSSCFFPPSELPPIDQITPDVIRCSENVMHFFDEMYATRLRV